MFTSVTHDGVIFLLLRVLGHIFVIVVPGSEHLHVSVLDLLSLLIILSTGCVVLSAPRHNRQFIVLKPRERLHVVELLVDVPLLLSPLVLHTDLEIFIHLFVSFDSVLSRLNLTLYLGHFFWSETSGVGSVIALEHLDLLDSTVRTEHDASPTLFSAESHGGMLRVLFQYGDRRFVSFEPLLTFFKTVVIASYISLAQKSDVRAASISMHVVRLVHSLTLRTGGSVHPIRVVSIRHPALIYYYLLMIDDVHISGLARV